jgi:hypothetical protein
LWGLANFLPRLTSNSYPPNLCLPSRWDYRCEPPYQANNHFFWCPFKNNHFFWCRILIFIWSITPGWLKSCLVAEGEAQAEVLMPGDGGAPQSLLGSRAS